jgi:hypothetical protein
MEGQGAGGFFEVVVDYDWRMGVQAVQGLGEANELFGRLVGQDSESDPAHSLLWHLLSCEERA